MHTLYDIVLFLSVYSIIRIAVYSLTSNLQTIRQYTAQHRAQKQYYRPYISVIVPADGH